MISIVFELARELFSETRNTKNLEINAKGRVKLLGYNWRHHLLQGRNPLVRSTLLDGQLDRTAGRENLLKVSLHDWVHSHNLAKVISMEPSCLQ